MSQDKTQKKVSGHWESATKKIEKGDILGGMDEAVSAFGLTVFHNAMTRSDDYNPWKAWGESMQCAIAIAWSPWSTH